MLHKHILDSSRVEVGIVWDLINDVSQICKEISLILICKHSRHTSIVELNLIIMHFDEVDRRVLRHQRCDGRLDDLRDRTLTDIST